MPVSFKDISRQSPGEPSSAIRERVIGDKNLLLAEITYETLQDKVALLKNPQAREEIIADGLVNAARFSWDKMTEEYTALYQNAMNCFHKQ